jgi:hypothetical protein
MKTTIDMDDELLALTRKRAAERGMTLKAFIEEALRARMLPRSLKKARFRMQLPVVEDKAPAAVDVADRDRLYDFMEGRS